VSAHPVLMHPDSCPRIDQRLQRRRQITSWKTKYDVVSVARGPGHEVSSARVQDELKMVRDATKDFKPQVVFNLAGAVSRRGVNYDTMSQGLPPV